MIDNYDLILVNSLIDIGTSGANRGFQLGLVYIATYVQVNGFKPKLIAGVNVVSAIHEIISKNEKLPLLGFYVTADNIQEVERVCVSIKNFFPEIKLILGGPEARVDSERLLRNRICDFVCSGGGEECTLQLLQYLNQKEDVRINNISNLVFISPINDKLIENPAFNLPYNLDHYPMPDRGLYSEDFLDTGHIATARGCASNCTFCFEGVDKKIRRHSTDRVIEEMLYLQKKYGTTYFSFVDDTFTTDRKKIYSLSEKIKENFKPYRNVTWYCEGKVSDICKDPNIVQTMVDAGLIRLQIGTESGNQNVLDLYKKGITIDQIYKAVEIASKTGLTSMFTNFIIGGAKETVETYRQTLSMAVDLMRLAPGILECSYTFLSPYKGTDVYKNPSKYDLEILDKDFITAPSDSYVFAHSKNLSRNQLLGMGQEFHQTISECMKNQVPNFTPIGIKNQFIYSNFGMSTTWYNFLNKDPFFRKWGLNIRTGHITQSTNEYIDLLQLIPCRTFELERIENNHLHWDLRGKKFYFEGYELFLAELASGKLTINEIAERAFSQFNSTISKAQITEGIISFYNNLANEFLLSYRRFS